MQNDGRLVHRMGRSTDPKDAEAVTSANMLHACVSGSMLAGISWMEGQQPVVQLVSRC